MKPVLAPRGGRLGAGRASRQRAVPRRPHGRDLQEGLLLQRLRARPALALNLGGGHFLDISGVSGVDSISDGRGSVFADFDNDGDLDVFLTTAQGEAHYLFRNNVGSANGFVRVELQGSQARDAFGTVVRVKTSAGVQTKIKSGGAGFLSHHDGRVLFGLGGDAAAEWIEVVWPDRSVQRFEGVPSGTAIRVVEGAEPVRVTERALPADRPAGRGPGLPGGAGLQAGGGLSEPEPEVRFR